jgi:hypothetical protein
LRHILPLPQALMHALKLMKLQRPDNKKKREMSKPQMNGLEENNY